MKPKKLILLCLLLQALFGGTRAVAKSVPACAAVGSPAYNLVVYTVGGSRAAFAFADRPEMSIDGNTFRVCSTVADVEYAAADISRFTLEDNDGSPAYNNFWLVVWTTDGRSAGYAFADRPGVTIDGDVFYVGKDGMKTVGYPAASILCFTIDDHFDESAGEVVGIGAPKADTPAVRPQLHLSPATLSLSDLAPDATVRIYDGSGRLVQTAAAGADGSLTLPLSPLRPGIYVVNAGQTSFKIIRK
jgi:hypothetical protein